MYIDCTFQYQFLVMGALPQFSESIFHMFYKVMFARKTSSPFGPVLSKVKSTFPNKITENVPFGNVFEKNHHLKT
jgi:hypothetical protein